MTVLRSPIKWIGGKCLQAPIILEHMMQASHECYVEVFGGAASVILRKPPASCEVYNDLDGELVNFWMQLREHPDELRQRIDSLPYSRELFLRWRRATSHEDPIEAAARFFYVARSSFSHMGPSVGWSHTRGSRQSNAASAFRHNCDRIPFVAERLRKTQIDNRDWSQVIQSYDGPRTLFYCDPPYVNESDRYRTGKLSRAWHIRLAVALERLQGFVAVSYYPHRLVDRLYAKWRRVKYAHRQFGANANASTQKVHTELLLLNYNEEGNRLW